jgi:hypothetical protein
MLVKGMSERRLVQKPSRNEAVRFTGFLPEGHAWSQAAYRLYSSRYHPVEEKSVSTASDGDFNADAEREAAALRSYPEILGPCNLIDAIRPPRSKTPVPGYAEVDIEARWRETIHTVDKDVILNKIIITKPFPVWEIQPQFKQRAAAAAVAAAAASAKARGPSPLMRSALGTLGSSRFLNSLKRISSKRVATDLAPGETHQPPASPALGVRLPPVAIFVTRTSTQSSRDSDAALPPPTPGQVQLASSIS